MDDHNIFVDDALLEQLFGGKPAAAPEREVSRVIRVEPTRPEPAEPEPEPVSAGAGEAVAATPVAEEVIAEPESADAPGEEPAEVMAEAEPATVAEAEAPAAEDPGPAAEGAAGVPESPAPGARHWIEAGEPQRALAIFEEAARTRPLTPSERWLQGAAWLAVGNHEAAAARFGELANELPGKAEIRFNQGLALAGAQQWTAAAGAFQSVVDQHPDSAAAQESLARCRAANGEWEAAALAYRAVSERRGDPAAREQEAACWRALARQTAEQRKYAEAAQWCARWAEASAQPAEAHYHGAVLLQQAGRRDEAVAAYQAALAADPHHASAANNLAVLLAVRGEEEEAQRWLPLAQASDDVAVKSGAHWNEALLAENAGDVQRAQECLLQVMASDFIPAEAPFRWGYWRLMDRDDVAAAEAFQQAAEKNPDQPESLFNLGLSLSRLDRLDEAQSSVQKAVQMDASHWEWFHALQDLAIRRGDAALAQEIQESLLSAQADHPDLSYNLGLLWQQEQNPEAAAQCYLRALELRTRFPEALQNLGHALKDLGRDDEAWTCWGKLGELEAMPH
jgi:tetratricopeptide (TPR) repeat protein